MFVVIMMAITLAFVFSLRAHSQNVVQQGNVFVQQQSVGDSTVTGYYYQDAKGVKHPVFLSCKGKAYCWMTSKNGKLYKKYLPKITEILNRKEK